MKKVLLLLSSVSLLHCSGNPPGDAPVARTQPSTSDNRLEVEDLDQPPENISLLVLAPGTDPAPLIGDIEHQLHGIVYHELPPRLMVVSVPNGADPVLSQLGVQARYQRAVDPAEVPSATIEEQRFVRVFSNRYFAGTVNPKLALSPTHKVAAPGEPFESAPLLAPAGIRSLATLAGGATSTITTPYASGTVVVSLILPESNGVAEPSTEDWTEDSIAEVYEKVQTALEAIKRSEPNDDLRFIIHYESSPASGGLPGTVDSDYEYGRHADFTNPQDEYNVSAPLLARLLGHPVTPEQIFDASYEYLNQLRDRYQADGAYYIKIGADANFTAGFRAHAYVNGPWTTLPSDTPWNTFMHESGHIFGALDEYCPDACTPTTALQGYLGMPNANATYVVGGDGIDNGQGENEPSLMSGNQANAVNGYTRGAWGWLDTDGDGVIEVRDTTPETAVSAAVTGPQVRLQGTVYDVPAIRVFGQVRISFNRIEALEYRLADTSDPTWFAIPLHQATTDGPVAIDVPLGAFPVGEHRVAVRSRNSAGNTDAEQLVDFIVGAPAGNSAPRLRLDADPPIGSVRSAFTLSAHAVDVDANDGAQVRFDTDGDGVFDTPFGSARTVAVQLGRPGVYTLAAEARDHSGFTTQAQVRVFVLDGNAPPVLHLAAAPSLRFGQAAVSSTFSVADSRDADGDPLEYNWIAELATDDGKLRIESGFAAGNTSFPVTLPTPPTLRTTKVDLATGDPSLVDHTWVTSVALTPHIVATAAGLKGLVVTDLTDSANPLLLAHLSLETNAQQLALDGSRLYVMGTLLTVVDVSNPKKVVELKQQQTLKNTYTDTQAPRGGSEEIPDASDKGVGLDHFLGQGERIDSLQLDVEVNHPAPAELYFELDYFDGSSLQVFPLRDHVAGRGGDKTYTFTTHNTPALAALVGKLASGQFEVRVADTVAGNVGTLVQSKLTVKTASRAFALLPGASLLVGTVPGPYVAVAGLGLQTIDARTPQKLKEASRLTGTGAMSGATSGSRALVISPLTVPPPKGVVLSADELAAAKQHPPQTHGLYAVELSSPQNPRVLRIDESLGEDGGDLAVIGSRFYVNQAGRGDTGSTQVDDLHAFFAGRAYQLGALPTRVDANSFGDDRLIWSVATGHVQEVDVSSPARAQVLADYTRPNAARITRLSGLNVLLNDGAQTSVANLNDVTNIISRTYRVTVQARDAAGELGSETRTVHVIPYDHAPSVTAAKTGGVRAGDTFTFLVTPTDPDSGTTWDPAFYTRADLDGDGLYETEWLQSGGRDGGAVTYQAPFFTPGSHTVRFQTRDTFYALAETVLTFTVQP